MTILEPFTALGLPRCLEPYFQEYDLDEIDPNQNSELVIERVLAYGSLSESLLLFNRYPRASIAAWVARMGVRRLPWRRYNMWCVLLDLPPALIIEALRAARTALAEKAARVSSAQRPALC